MKRVPIDLSHHVLQTGEIGRLQTFMQIPVLPGDSFSVATKAMIHLSPLRRKMLMDCNVHMAYFFIPHRYVYLDRWRNYIKGGVDFVTSFSSLPRTSVPGVTSAGEEIPSLLWNNRSQVNIPLHIPAGYTKIVDSFYRDPQDERSVSRAVFGNHSFLNPRTFPSLGQPSADSDLWDNNSDGRDFGARVARLKTFHTTMRQHTGQEVTQADKDVAVTNNKMDIEDFAKTVARYKSESARDWVNGRYYKDIMKLFWGTNVSDDEERLPKYLGGGSQWLSGMEIYGTSTYTLGASAGKGMGVIKSGFPRRFFPEHGTLWGVMALRFPPVFYHEKHFMSDITHFSDYAMQAGEWSNKAYAPVALTYGDHFGDSSSNNVIGLQPWDQWYRTHTSYSHPFLDDDNSGAGRDTGYPILASPTTWEEAIYEDPSQFKKMFLSVQNGHWHGIVQNQVMSQRMIGDPKTSISILA